VEYIKAVKSNIKGGVDVEIAKNTVLVGPMGSGKSSVVQAIQLAADGSVRDGEGRDKIKDFASVARFFPADQKALFSTLILSDDTKRHWEIKKSGTTWKGAKPTEDFTIAFPFEDVKAILAKSDKEIRAWLSQEVLGTVELDSILAVVTNDEAEVLRWLVKEERCEIDWNVIAAAAKKKATSLRRQATVKEKTVGQLTEGVSTPLSPKEIAVIKEDISTLTTELSSAHKGSASGKAMLAQDLTAARMRVSELELQAQELAAVPSEPVDESEQALIRALRNILISHVHHFGATNCMVCRSKDIEDNLIKQVEIVEAALAEGQVDRAKAANAAHLAEARDALVAKQAEYDAYVVQDVSAIREKLSGLNNKIAGDIASQRAWANVKAVNTEISRLRSQADNLVSASKTLEKVGRKRLEEGMETFCDEVSHWLPSGVEAGVDLTAGRVGFRREDGSLHTALSGGEWSAMVMALGCYQMNKQDNAAVPVLTPDDRGWDPDGLSKVMTAVQDYPGQVIIMSTVMPSAVRSEWCIVDLSEQ
jgi:hypothetical protein